MRGKIKFLSIVMICILIFSTVAFATSNDADNAQTNTILEENNIDTTDNSTEDLAPIDSSDEIEEDIEIPEGFEYLEDDLSSLDENYLDAQDYDDSEYINDDLYIAEDEINIEKVINGNAYLMGNTVSINSEYIDGNIFIIANEVNINSDIYMSAYIIADKININSGAITDAYFMANKVDIGEEAYIYRNARIATDTLNLNGEISGNLYSLADTNNINGRIGGKLTYSGVLNKGTDAIIESTEEIKTIEKSSIDSNIKEIGASIKRFFTAWKICTAIIVIFIIVLLKRESFNIVEKDENSKKVYCTSKSVQKLPIDILKGLVYLGLSFFIILVLFFTILGIPLGLLLISVFSVTLYIATPIACIEIAQLIKIKSDSKGKIKFIIALVAIAVYILLVLIKSIGTIGVLAKFLSFLILLYGLGTIVNMVFFRNDEKNFSNNNKNDEIITTNNIDAISDSHSEESSTNTNDQKNETDDNN